MTNEELFPLVAARDQKSRDALIEANMALVKFKADAYIAMFPHLEYLRDDMIGEGNLSLVEAVDRIRDGVVSNAGNITGYLSIAVQKSIGHLIDNELYSSDRTARRDRLNGDEPRPLHKVPDSEHVIGELEFDPRKEVDLLELILGCCETDEERAIVDLRTKGYVDIEVARQLDIPRSTVQLLRLDLYRRVVATGEVVAD
jgi:hypothetical protein